MEKYTDHGIYWDNEWTEPERLLREIGNFLPRLESGRVLDLGCSYGLTTRDLARKYPGCEIIGIDRKRKIIDAAPGFGEVPQNARFDVADGYKSPFSRRSFDIVVCMNNIACIYQDYPDRSVIQNEMTRIGEMVKKQGWLMVSDGPYVMRLKRNGNWKLDVATRGSVRLFGGLVEGLTGRLGFWMDAMARLRA